MILYDLSRCFFGSPAFVFQLNIVASHSSAAEVLLYNALLSKAKISEYKLMGALSFQHYAEMLRANVAIRYADEVIATQQAML